MYMDLKNLDYEILRQIKEFRDSGLTVLNRNLGSSTKIGRIGILKKKGYIEKHGKTKGRGTLYLTQLGERALRNIPAHISKMKSLKLNGEPRYLMKIETISGPKINFEMEIASNQSEIINALSNALNEIGKKKQKAVEAPNEDEKQF